MIELTGEGGEGDSTRPVSVSKEVKDLRYTLDFGNKEEKLEARMELVALGEIKDE